MAGPKLSEQQPNPMRPAAPGAKFCPRCGKPGARKNVPGFEVWVCGSNPSGHGEIFRKAIETPPVTK